jgi:hypothetical protein
MSVGVDEAMEFRLLRHGGERVRKHVGANYPSGGGHAGDTPCEAAAFIVAKARERGASKIRVEEENESRLLSFEYPLFCSDLPEIRRQLAELLASQPDIQLVD